MQLQRKNKVCYKETIGKGLNFYARTKLNQIIFKPNKINVNNKIYYMSMVAVKWHGTVAPVKY